MAKNTKSQTVTPAKKPAGKKPNSARTKPNSASNAAKKPTGRPSTYNREVADKILELIKQGQSLTSICKPDDMPAISTFRTWVADDVDGLSARSARAYEVGYDAIADQCVEIADEEPEIHPLTGAKDSASVQHKRLRIDTRLRLLGKWAPKKYGDKLELGGEVKVGVAEAIREARERAAKR